MNESEVMSMVGGGEQRDDDHFDSLGLITNFCLQMSDQRLPVEVSVETLQDNSENI